MASAETRARLLTFFHERFGIPEVVFEGYLLIERGRNIWIVRDSPHVHVAAPHGIHTFGLRLARETSIGLKPTTYGLQIFGRHATRSRAELSREDAVRFLRGKDVQLEPSADLEPGFIVVASEGFVLGCGLYKGTGLLRSLIPKKIRLDAPRDEPPAQ